MRELTLVMVSDIGFYTVTSVVPEGHTDSEVAEAHGALNDHVDRIDNVRGETLWERTQH